MLHLLSLIRSTACDVCNGAVMLGKDERRVREGGAERQWPVPGRGQDNFAPRIRIQSGMGDVVVEVDLGWTLIAAADGSRRGLIPPPCPTTTGIQHLPGLEKGCRGTRGTYQGLSGRIERHQVSSSPTLEPLAAMLADTSSSRDLRAHLKRRGMGFATQYWSGLSWISTRLVSCCIPPPSWLQGTEDMVIMDGHFRDPCTFEILIPRPGLNPGTQGTSGSIW